LLGLLSFFEPMLVQLHIHASPPKRHTFHLKSEALFQPGFARQLDLSARAQNALPRQAFRTLQNSCH
jgi:hypothetical protein